MVWVKKCGVKNNASDDTCLATKNNKGSVQKLKKTRVFVIGRYLYF